MSLGFESASSWSCFQAFHFCTPFVFCFFVFFREPEKFEPDMQYRMSDAPVVQESYPPVECKIFAAVNLSVCGCCGSVVWCILVLLGINKLCSLVSLTAKGVAVKSQASTKVRSFLHVKVFPLKSFNFFSKLKSEDD